MVTQRISTWVPLRDDKLGLNARIVKWNERADAHLWPVNLNPTVYVLADVFTTLLGQWIYQNDERYTVPQWAISAYNFIPWGEPGFFDDAGADHNMFAAVRGLDGKWKKDWQVAFGQQGVTLDVLTKQGAWELHPIKASGWANVPVYNLFFPDQGQTGGWAAWPFGASDILVGGGMPYNNHVSLFGVWQEVPREDTNGGGGGNGGTDSTEALALLREIRDAIRSGFRL